MEIGPPVPEKDFLKVFYHIRAWRPSWSCDQHHVIRFSFLYLKAFIQNLVQNGSVVSEKKRFEYLYVHDLGQRSRNDLDLQYSHTFIKSFSCLYLPTFRSQASIASEKSTVFTFSYRTYIEAIVLSMYDKFQLHTPYGLSVDFNFFYIN